MLSRTASHIGKSGPECTQVVRRWRKRNTGRPPTGFGSIPPNLSPPHRALRRSFGTLDQEVRAWIHKANLAA